MRILESSETENQLPPEKVYCELRRAPSFSGPLMVPNRASASSLSAPKKSSAGYRDNDKSKTNFGQKKGRFLVTSKNVDVKGTRSNQVKVHGDDNDFHLEELEAHFPL